VPVTLSEEALAQRVVDVSKKTAHVDTGALKRSIHYTVSRGQIVFRQLFYGQYYENSQLIQNAARLMKGIPYTIEELDEEGSVVKEQRKAASGRATTSEERKPRAGKNSALGAKALIEKLLAQRRRYATKNNEQENN
jgi:hypothetical protein